MQKYFNHQVEHLVKHYVFRRIYKAQKNGNMDTPETESLFFETLDHLGHSKTYAVDKQVVDSASSATAMFTGVKTKYGNN